MRLLLLVCIRLYKSIRGGNFLDKIDFISWLEKNTTLSPSSVKKYAAAVGTIEANLTNYQLPIKSLYNIDDTSVIDLIKDIPEFKEKDSKGNHMYSSALTHFTNYYKDKKINQLDRESSNPSIKKLEFIPYFWISLTQFIPTNQIDQSSEFFYPVKSEINEKEQSEILQNIKPGDKLVIFNPTLEEVVAFGQVTKEIHRWSDSSLIESITGFRFNFVTNVSKITWEQIINVEELQDSAPVKNAAQGSLFPLTKEEYEAILAIEEPVAEEYQVEIPSVDFTREVEINGLHFEGKDLILKQVKTALSKGKNIILIGPPGTGKSKMAKEICRSFDVGYEMTTATSDWSTYETIGGNRPNSDGTLSFQQGLFLNCFKDSKTNKLLNKWLIIDEMNRADIDKAFGAMFSALTGDKINLSFQGKSGQNISVIPEKHVDHVIPNDYEYIIPEDWRLIGTMNTIDKASLYEMSYAFMRRFAFIPVGVPKGISEELVDSYLPLWGIHEYNYSEVLAQVWAYINDYRQIGPAIIEDLAKFTVEDGDFTSAVILYVLPQFEGLQDYEITEFVDKLGQLDGIEKDRLMEFTRDFFHIKE